VGNGQFPPSHSSLSSFGILTIFSGGDPYRNLMLPFLSLTMISTQPETDAMSMSLSFLNILHPHRTNKLFMLNI